MLGNLGFLDRQGRCYTFDSRGKGYGRGEGLIGLVLKPLDQAVKAGNVVRAVIRGTASNQDGKTSVLTQPSPQAQEASIRRAYEKAGLGFAATRYVEAHGKILIHSGRDLMMLELTRSYFEKEPELQSEIPLRLPALEQFLANAAPKRSLFMCKPVLHFSGPDQVTGWAA